MQPGSRSTGRSLRRSAILALLLSCSIPLTARAQVAQVGIFSDPSRSSCSLSDAAGGEIRAYVVANTTGMTGIRFAATKPDCFNATWLYDEVHPGYISIGDSQTDISIATGTCESGLRVVLTMVFQKTSTTTPCCLYELTPPAIVENVEYTDCAFVEHPLPTTPAYVNANATCPCSTNVDFPPSAPFNPNPTPGMTNIPTNVALTWDATDPENEPLHYDVYFGTDPAPPLAAPDVAQPQYSPAGLVYNTTYHWKVVVKDNAGNATDGAVWSFTTSTDAGVPPTPVSPNPLDGSTDVLRTTQLEWDIVGGSGPATSYEIYFGHTNPPPLLATIAPTINPSYLVENLVFDTTYYWYVKSIALGGKSTTGATWSFHTITSNVPPNQPSSPSPGHAATGVDFNVLLQWYASDPEGQTVSYDVYFGTTASPPFLSHTLSPEKAVSNLLASTRYYWRVVAIDSEGASASGATWYFTTRGTGSPSVPSLVAPALGSTISAVGAVLQWTASDPQGGPLKYNIYLGTSNPPPLFESYHSGGTLVLSAPLQQDVTYYWQIVATDQDFNSTQGPVWNFQTRAPVAPPAPSNPSPAPGTTTNVRRPPLSWHCVDPVAGPLTFQVSIAHDGIWSVYGEIPDTTFTPPVPLLWGETYNWKVQSENTDHLFAESSTWIFTVGGTNLPPTAPVNFYPVHLATDMSTAVTLQWSASDPENAPLTYDVYFGTSPTPPLVKSNNALPFYDVSNLLHATNYYWQVLARDIDGNTAISPVWKFTTLVTSTADLKLGLYADAPGTSCSLADPSPGMRTVYVVLNGPDTYTGARFKATKPGCFNATWLFDTTPYVTIGDSQSDMSVAFGTCMEGPINVMSITYQSVGNTPGCCQYALEAAPVVGTLVVTDCTFQELVPEGLPVLGISSNNAICPSCDSFGVLSFVQAEDSCTTSGPHEMTIDLNLSAGDSVSTGGVDIILDPQLTLVSCERGAMIEDWPSFNYDVQSNVITVTASGPVIPRGTNGVFARLKVTTDCCAWTSLAELGLAAPTGDLVQHHVVARQLECRYPNDGDVNNDGSITVADAQCALEAYLYLPLPPPGGCGGPGARTRGDVDCSGAPTPGDAYCIFKQWLDQSCSFCNGGAVAMSASLPSPRLSLRTMREDEEIVVVLSANGSGEVGALGFELKYPKELVLMRAEPPRKDTFAALQTRLVEPGRVRVGAYANSGKTLSASGDILALRFHAPGEVRGTVTAQRFVDDLAGAQDVTVSLQAALAVMPPQVVLHQNSPNPFNPRTMIRFELPEPMHVRLTIFDVHGRLVKQLLDERREAGVSTMDWDGTDSHARNVATGVYFYVLDAGGSRLQRKMVLLK